MKPIGIMVIVLAISVLLYAEFNTGEQIKSLSIQESLDYQDIKGHLDILDQAYKQQQYEIDIFTEKKR